MTDINPTPYHAHQDLHVLDSIEAYLAGGFSTPEREAFDAHIALCGSCAAALDEARQADSALVAMFASAHPGTDFEERLVGRFRLSRSSGAVRSFKASPWPKILLHPAVRRVATGVAAAVVLGAIGSIARSGLANQSLPLMAHGTQFADLQSDLLMANWGRHSGMKPEKNFRQIARYDQMDDEKDQSSSVSRPDFGRPHVKSGIWPERDQAAANRTQIQFADSADAGAITKSEYMVEGLSGGLKYRSSDAQKPPASGPGADAGQFRAPAALPEAPRPEAAEKPAASHGIAQAPQLQVVASVDRKGISAVGGGSAGGGSGGNVWNLPTDGRLAAGRNGQDGTYSYEVPIAAKPAEGKAPEQAVERMAVLDPGAAGAAKLSIADSFKPAELFKTLGEKEKLPGLAQKVEQPPTMTPPGQKDEAGTALGRGELKESTQATFADGITPPAGTPAPAPADADPAHEPALAAATAAAAPTTPAPPNPDSAPKSEPPVATPPPAALAPATPIPQQVAERKIIRNGDMSFEVDAFDSAMMQVTKIAAEEGGFVATTDSEKLPNGKVKGTVILRCPPDRLDTLVLKLRGLGDLKSQKIAAQDITKQYTDLESQLRAASAMQERLLQIIKDGKGAIKDLLEAEKQLGVWREKIEGLEGEIRYYNNLVSLSTLTVSLVERDIKTPYATAQSEEVSMGLEAEDVEKARLDAIKQIEDAKGRILDSDLKKEAAGQFAATIVAVVPPDNADPLIDRLKQVGRVARLDRQRKQISEGGTGAPPPGLHIERKETRLQISLYNLANIAPRTTTSLNLAAPDVEKAYQSIVDQVKSGGGRVVASQLNRPKADQVSGTITFEVPAEKADVLAAAVRGGVEVMRMDVTENPDTQNVTDTKKGFSLQIYSLATVAPRETTVLQIASRDVPMAFSKLLEAARTAGGRIITSQLNEQNVANIVGTLDFDAPRDNYAKVEAAFHEAGLTVTRNVTRSADSENTVDSKVRLQISLIDDINLTARQSIGQTIAARNVPEAFNKLADAVREAGARIVTSQLTDQDKPTVTGQLIFSIERENIARAEAAIKEAGETVGRSVTRSADLQNTVDTKVLYQVAVRDQRTLDARETVTENVAVHDVPSRFAKILDTLRLLDAQVINSQLIEQDKNQVSATLNFTVRRDIGGTKEQAAVEKVLDDSADVFGRSVVRSQDTNAVESKVHYGVTLIDADTQKPRETYTVEAEVSDVDKALADLEAAGVAAGGRAVDSTPVTGKNEKGETIGRIFIDVPMSRSGEVVNAIRDKARVTTTRRSRNDQVPEGTLSRARVEITVTTGAIMAGEGGIWDTVKSGLRTSVNGLLLTLEMIVVGLCLIGPWALLLWIGWRLIRRARKNRTTDKPVMSPVLPGPAVTPG